MPGSSGSARVCRAALRFAGMGFAGVGFGATGSAPSLKAKLNETKQKNNKRKADIRGNLAKVNAYLAEAAGYARRRCLSRNKATNLQAILFAAESKVRSTLPQFLQLRDERCGAIGKVTVIPP